MKEKDLNKMSVAEMGDYVKELNDVYTKLSEFEKLKESDKIKKINNILLKNGVPKRYLIKKIFNDGFNFHDNKVDIRGFLTDKNYIKDVLSSKVITILNLADKLSDGMSDDLKIISIEKEENICIADTGEYSLKLKYEKLDRVYKLYIDFDNNDNGNFKINYGFIKYIEIEFYPVTTASDFCNNYDIYNGDDELIFNLHSSDGNYATTDDIEKIVKGINEGIKEFKDNMINIIKNI